MLTTCPSKETMKDYLHGWIEEQEASIIESHLQSCADCDRVIVEVENEAPPTIASQSGANIAIDSIVGYAFSLAKRHPPESSAATPTTDNSAASSQLVNRQIGPYELLRMLGHGGMGSVYLARHRQLQKFVAVKIFPARWLGNEQHQTRFQREIRAAGGLSHPAIVTATDAGQDDDVHYLVMEHIDGLDLAAPRGFAANW